jgi:preprotein translocase subunit YajC
MFEQMSFTLTLAQTDQPPAGSPDETAPPANGAEQPDPGQAADGNGPNGTTEQPAGQGDPNQPGEGATGPDYMPIIMIVGLVVIFYLLILWPQRREKKKRQAMLSQLTKGAKVQTIGGVIGTVTDLRDDEVVVKVDEGTNTKMRFNRGAIQQVFSSES